MDQKIDKYGNIYMIFDIDKYIYGYDIIRNIGLGKFIALVENKEIKDLYMTYVENDNNEDIDYSLLENRKNSENIIKLYDKDIIENKKYKFPIIYVIFNNKHIAVNNNDFVLPPEEKAFKDDGKIG